MKVLETLLVFMVLITTLYAEINSSTLRTVSKKIRFKVKPNANTLVTATFEGPKTGIDWSLVFLKFYGDAMWKDADIHYDPTFPTVPGSDPETVQVTFSKKVRAPKQTGLHTIQWTPSYRNGRKIGSIMRRVIEVTCDDGIFCNGNEEWSGNRCVKSILSPCDDGIECTTDVCDETTQKCSYILGDDCATCTQPPCERICAEENACGADSCGGSCGTCEDGLLCKNGQCASGGANGTCAQPLPLIAPGEPLLGYHFASGDNSKSFNLLSPKCIPASDAPEIVYYFVVPPGHRPVGVDARIISGSIDSVLELRQNSCFDSSASITCNDDAIPPGDYHSRITAMVNPGTYYIIVDSYNLEVAGDFVLSVNLVDECVPFCDSKFCGDDGCGGTCGDCGEGRACSMINRCIDSPCISNCTGRECGDDGCLGVCGTCDPVNGNLCVWEENTCQQFEVCNHLLPKCPSGCKKDYYCGTDCACHKLGEALPDLVLDDQLTLDTISFETRLFENTSCAIYESCVGGTGMRRLLRFSVGALNQGGAPFAPPGIPVERPDLFVWSPCHGHYHFENFAKYQLKDEFGTVLVVGRKQAYCMVDSHQGIFSPAFNCITQSSCSEQSIQPGWVDVYSSDFDCQWIDITGVPSGNYELVVRVNIGRALHEVSFRNNVMTVPVFIPEEDPTK